MSLQGWSLKEVHRALKCCVQLPLDVAFKCPLKPTSFNTRCGSRTKTHLVVTWASGVYSLKELSHSDLWLFTFLSFSSFPAQALQQLLAVHVEQQLLGHCCWLWHLSVCSGLGGRGSFISPHKGHAAPPDSPDDCFQELWLIFEKLFLGMGCTKGHAETPNEHRTKRGKGGMPWRELQTSNVMWYIRMNSPPQQVGSPGKETHFWREK